MAGVNRAHYSAMMSRKGSGQITKIAKITAHWQATILPHLPLFLLLTATKHLPLLSVPRVGFVL
jgi:hypothetical protein